MLRQIVEEENKQTKLRDGERERDCVEENNNVNLKTSIVFIFVSLSFRVNIILSVFDGLDFV